MDNRRIARELMKLAKRLEGGNPKKRDQKLLEIITDEPGISYDEILEYMESFGFPYYEVAAGLMMLEQRREIKQSPNKTFVRMARKLEGEDKYYYPEQIAKLFPDGCFDAKTINFMGPGKLEKSVSNMLKLIKEWKNSQ